MLGLSVYLFSSKEQQEKTLSLLTKDDYCFVSLHHPLDIDENFKEKTFDLIERINKTGAKIVADIAPMGIEHLGYKSFEDLAKANLMWGLRPDYGLSAQEIFDASKYTNIVINASNIDVELVELFNKNNTKFYAMHNFYPRPETGLDISYSNECTKYLQDMGAEVWAFIGGDKDLRGSVFEGLPTIEEYRQYPPYVQYCLLKNICNIDLIFVGDVSLTDYSLNLIHETESDGVLRLPSKIDEKFANELYGKTFTVRLDNNSIVARLQESRTAENIGQKIETYNANKVRNLGAITMDNSDYSVYSGEIQVCLQDLPADERVNLIGEVQDEYKTLLQLNMRARKLMFVN